MGSELSHTGAKESAVTNAHLPNLVFVYPDQFRQHAMGFMRQDPVITPNLDRFASESLVFTNAVSSRPLCSPHRAMLMTGKYPHANGVLTNCNSRMFEFGNFLKETERCLSDVLNDVGYSQGYVGKYHLDAPLAVNYQYTEGPRGDGVAWDGYTPPGPRRHGFDFWHAYGCHDWHLSPHYWVGDARADERMDVDEWSVKHETDVAIEYIRNRDGKHRSPETPFSLFVAFNPPHPPFGLVPPQYVEMYGDRSDEDLLTRPNVNVEDEAIRRRCQAKNYFAAITGIDEQFDRILECLREEGLEENTIVVFTSDHGEMLGSHGRMQKTVWYDETLLVPFLIRWPGKIGPGTDDLLLSAPDIMPSLLHLMGLGDQVPSDVEGSDYSSIMVGQECTRPSSALYLDVQPEWPEEGKRWPAGGKRGLRTDRHTFVVERGKVQDDTYILHDNTDDPYQLRNVAGENPAIVKQLMEELRDWLDRTNDPWLGATAEGG